MSRNQRCRVAAVAAVLLLVLVFIICCFYTQKEPQLPQFSSTPLQIPVLLADGSIEKMDIEQFLVGVVSAEMPASFSAEALKAQAVAARSYIMRRVESGNYKHGEAVVCCDSTCCQAYCDNKALREKWGESYAVYYEKIWQAVQSTTGQLLCYQGKVAETPFCSTCGGRSERAADCWSNDIPYLQSVNCDFCRHSPRFTSARSFSLGEAALLLQTGQEQLSSMCVASLTDGGRVRWLYVGGQELSGTEVRTLLGLPSAIFTWLVLGDTISFFSLGYGHGVGLCQYGADGMAQAGYVYTDILALYYGGTDLLHVNEVPGLQEFVRQNEAAVQSSL